MNPTPDAVGLLLVERFPDSLVDMVKEWDSGCLVMTIKPRVSVPALGVPRSPKWAKLRTEFLVENPECEACGTRELLNVHHRVPVHVDRSKELIWANLITLCERPSHNCHFVFGHLGNWSWYNESVALDAIRHRERRRQFLENRG
jgi:hypothetical protein